MAALVGGCASNVAVQAGQPAPGRRRAADTLYLIRRGRVALEVHAPGAAPLVIETLGPGPGRVVVAVPALPSGSSTLAPPSRSGRSPWTRCCLRAKAEADPAFGYELMKRFAAVMLERLQAARLRLLDLYARRRPTRQRAGRWLGASLDATRKHDRARGRADHAPRRPRPFVPEPYRVVARRVEATTSSHFPWSRSPDDPRLPGRAVQHADRLRRR